MKKIGLIFLSGTLAFAQTKNTTFEEELFVTATKYEITLKNSPFFLEKINYQIVEEGDFFFVYEALNYFSSSLSVVQSGGYGKLTSLFVRGAGSNQTLVLFKGIKLNSTLSGGFDFANLHSSGLDIELLKGSQSSVYGSEAMGGVINLIPVYKRDYKYKLMFSYGSRSSKLASFSGVRSFDKARWYADINYFDSDGFSAASELRGNTERDPTRSLSVISGINLLFGDRAFVDVDSLLVKAKGSLDGFSFATGLPEDDPNYISEQDLRVLALNAGFSFSPRVEQYFIAGSVRDNYVGKDEDTLFHNFDMTSKNSTVESYSRVNFTNYSFILGLGAEDRKGVSDNNFDRSIKLKYVYLQNHLQLPRFTLNFGVRTDDHSLFGTETTYRLSSFVQLFDQIGMVANYSTGFRAPTINDLYFPGYSNPELLPETSISYEIGIKGEVTNVSYLVSYFSTEFKDLIIFDFTTFKPANIGRAKVEGFETVLRAKTKSFDIRGSYTNLKTLDIQTGRPLPRRPKHKLVVSLFYKAGSIPLKLFGTINVARERFEFNGEKLDDYNLLSVGIFYRFNSRMTFSLKVDNLTDERYEDIKGYTAPGRTTRGGIVFRW